MAGRSVADDDRGDGRIGFGKSSIGTMLTDRLDLPFLDGDDLHPAANVARMRAGPPLEKYRLF